MGGGRICCFEGFAAAAAEEGGFDTEAAGTGVELWDCGSAVGALVVLEDPEGAWDEDGAAFRRLTAVGLKDMPFFFRRELILPNRLRRQSQLV